MSRHPLDRIALVFGIPLLVLGIGGTADDTGAVSDAAWLWIGLCAALAVAGLVLAIGGELRRVRRAR